MNYIANSYFHYIKKEEYLIDILTNGLQPRYVFEDYKQLLPKYKDKNISTEVAVPMLCFCDIPLALVSEHTNEYGEFAIGLSHDWGLKNLNPIFYLKNNSVLNNFLNFIQEKYLNFQLPQDEFENRFRVWQDFIAFIKPYSGISLKTNKKKEFYQEREWRWVPEIKQAEKTQGVILRILKKEVDEGTIDMEEKNGLLRKNYKLDYMVGDITYIVVPDNKIKKEIANKIYGMTNLGDIPLLISKIISLQEIKENF